MTAPTEVDIGTLIERRPGVYGGRPVLKGTRFPVLQIAVLHNEGQDAEEIQRRWLPHVDISLIYAGIAFYLANRDAIDAELEEERVAYEAAALESARPEPASEQRH
jgi:uncharacterized protein (DUF433 family)